jgi:CelD/BcsL family acetyltransferase involved in cellulose biosynthesis
VERDIRGQADAHELRVEVITDIDALAALEPAWNRLLLRSPASSAFASPAWLLTWYRHFEKPGGVYAVTVWRGDELVGLAPFARTGPRPAQGGLPGFQLLVSAGTEHGDYGEPLLGADAGPVAEAIAEHLATFVREHHAAVNMRRLHTGGATLPAVEAREDITVMPMGQAAEAALVRFDLMDDAERELDRLARKHGIPRRLRRLAEDRGPVGYVIDDPDTGAALDDMREQLRERWEPGTGPRMFSSPKLERFTRALICALIVAGLGCVSSLTVRDERAAISTVTRVGGRHLSDNASFASHLAPYGVGQAELYHMLRSALAGGATEVDLRAGDFPYKHRWANATRGSRSVVLLPAGARRPVVVAARRITMSIRARSLRRDAGEADEADEADEAVLEA